MSLVAAYSDSESDEETPKNDESNPVSTNDTELNSKLNEPEVTSAKSLNNFLVSPTADSDSSESDSEDDSKKRKQKSRLKLENPFRTFGGTTNVPKEDSVFRNPFREKEEQKIAVLEHHVKMTDNPETVLEINGKKICWNYRKRKCYLGTQCPYAHDSDVPLTEEQLKEQKAEDDLHRSAAGNTALLGGSKNPFAPQSKSHLPGTASVVAGGYDSSAFYSSPHLGGSGGHKSSSSCTNGDNSEQPVSKSNKKRVGLTNSLIPPKKALNLYHKTKDL